MLTVLSPYLVKLVIFDIVFVLLFFSRKVLTQLRCGRQIFEDCVQIIPDDNSERIT